MAKKLPKYPNTCGFCPKKCGNPWCVTNKENVKNERKR